MADSSSVITVPGVSGAAEPAAPFFDLREPVIYPYSLTPLTVEGEMNAAALRVAMAGDRLLALFPELPDEADTDRLPIPISLKVFSFQEKQRSAAGILVRVVKELKFPDGSVRILVRGIRRIFHTEFFPSVGGVTIARFVPVVESGDGRSPDIRARVKGAGALFQELAGMLPGISEELQVAVLNAGSPGRFCGRPSCGNSCGRFSSSWRRTPATPTSWSWRPGSGRPNCRRRCWRWSARSSPGWR